MIILTEKEYLEFYEKYGRCIDEHFPRKNPYTHKAVLTRYKKYRRKLENKSKEEPKTDSRWNTVRRNVQLRDGSCRLISRLSKSQIIVIKSRSGGLHSINDPAHVFGKGPYPHMKYDEDNVILLNRYSHSMLDSGKDPIYGKIISKQEQEDWWRFIVGEEHYEVLKKRSRRREY